MAFGLLIDPQYQSLLSSQTIIGNVTATFQKSFMFLLDEEVVARKPVRVSAMATSATSDNPIVFTARQILGILY